MKILAQSSTASAALGVAGVVYLAFLRGLSAPPGPALRASESERAVEPSVIPLVSALIPSFFVLAATVALFYVFLFLQSTATFTAHSQARAEARKSDKKAPTLQEVKYTNPKATWCANRTVGNYMEQWPCFVVALLLHALLVDANRAALLGWVWLGARAYYPLAFSLPFPGLLASTVPAYGVVWYLLGTAVYAAVSI